MLEVIYTIDVMMLLLAMAATASAVAQLRQRIVRHWVLLAPGVFATLASILVLSYPDVRDLLQLEVWSVAVVGLLPGAVRGHFMRIDSDHNWLLARVQWAHDGLWAAIAVLALAVIQFTLEIRLRQQNPFENSLELPMVLVSGYLLGRSITCWIRARSTMHVDLHE